MTLADSSAREDAQRLADRILSVPGVADLHSGMFGEVGLLFPGARVPGLRVEGREQTRLQVHIVLDLATAPDVSQVASAVRAAAAEVTDDPVDVIVADAVDTRDTPEA